MRRERDRARVAHLAAGPRRPSSSARRSRAGRPCGRRSCRGPPGSSRLAVLALRARREHAAPARPGARPPARASRRRRATKTASSRRIRRFACSSRTAASGRGRRTDRRPGRRHEAVLAAARAPGSAARRARSRARDWSAAFRRAASCARCARLVELEVQPQHGDVDERRRRRAGPPMTAIQTTPRARRALLGAPLGCLRSAATSADFAAGAAARARRSGAATAASANHRQLTDLHRRAEPRRLRRAGCGRPRTRTAGSRRRGVSAAARARGRTRRAGSRAGRCSRAPRRGGSA